jgi:hypothetical protein
MLRVAAAIAAAVWAGVFVADAVAAVTPGWECIPTAAGQAVVSGGTGAAPSCAAGRTAVLAPTYVSSGVGGKPTVVFAALNVQVVSGSGSTSGAVNGVGNVVIGYAENSNGYLRPGSHDLVVGANNGWKGYGEIVGGNKDQASGNYAAVVGQSNVASGPASFAGGQANTASGAGASASGGMHNVAKGAQASVVGGEFNLASDPFAGIVAGCDGVAGTGNRLVASCSAAGIEGILGGFQPTASGLESTVSSGEGDTASGRAASVSGGIFSFASGEAAVVVGGNESEATGNFASVLGGFQNTASTFDATVSGGFSNTASAEGASVLGGRFNKATSKCQAIPAAPGSC